MNFHNVTEIRRPLIRESHQFRNNLSHSGFDGARVCVRDVHRQPATAPNMKGRLWSKRQRAQELNLRPLGYEPATWSPAIATISSPMRSSSSSPATQKGSGHTAERLGIE